jgi:cell division protein FtsZ
LPSYGSTPDYSHLDVPAVVRKGNRNVTVEALANSGVDRYDIPAFLRKQAD